MGLFDIFRKKDDEPELDPLQDLVLAKLKVGYLVDYELETWTVTGYNRYEFGRNEVEEWELTGSQGKRYLERVEDDDVEWSLGKKIPLAAIDGNIKRHILEHDDPPERVTYKGTQYFLDGSAAGYMYAGGQGQRHELIQWEYVDEDDERFLTIEQWGEEEFEAAAGTYVEEYQFSNILPGGGT